MNPRYSMFIKRLVVAVAGSVIILSVVIVSSKTVHAGLISFISSAFGSERASAKTEQVVSKSNSQTLALLESAANHIPIAEKSMTVVPIDNKGTLVADLALSDSDAGSPVNTQVSTYVVRSGDTISDVAVMFDVSVNTILWANDLTSKSVLKTGQTIVILPISGITYTVRKGDILSNIAKKYSADADEVLAYNDLSSASAIREGQTIIIPNAELAASVPTRIVTGKDKAYNTSGPAYSGYYIRPIRGGVRTQGLHGDNGVDLADKSGTPIFASAEGTAIVSRSGGWNGGYGTFIIISHPNKTQTLYAHNSKNLVSVGDAVAQGEQIAVMGSTGKSTGPHVHFEIRGAKNPF